MGRSNNKTICIKVDLWKAFDSINRYFIIHVMKEMNFMDKRMNIIGETIDIPYFFVIYQRSLFGFFIAFQSFVKATLYLLSILNCNRIFHIIHGPKSYGKITSIGKGFDSITHNIYVDDRVIFTKECDDGRSNLGCVYRNEPSYWTKDKQREVQNFQGEGVSNGEEIAGVKC